MSDTGIAATRREVVKLNQELRVSSHLLKSGNLGLSDMAMMVRLFTGGSTALRDLENALYAALAAATLLKTVLTIIAPEFSILGTLGRVFGVGGAVSTGQTALTSFMDIASMG